MDKLKALLGGSKKAAAGCLLVALATLAAVIYYIIYSVGLSAAAEGPDTASAAPAESLPTVGVTLEDARQTVLEDAGLTASQATFSVEALREEQGVWMYQLSFRSWNSQFEYLVNADTGAIYSRSKETRVVSAPEPSPSSGPDPTPEQDPPAETASQSPETSQPPETSRPPETSQPPEASQPLESDPPASGEPEPSPSPEASAPSSMYIGMNRAKSIALEHAGLTSARFTSLRMDRKDGRVVYQLKFRQDGSAYEYEIDASNGRVLAHQRGEEGG